MALTAALAACGGGENSSEVAGAAMALHGDIQNSRHSMVKINTGGERPLDIAFDPKRPDVLYMDRSRDLRFSADAGTTWNTIAPKHFFWLGTGHMSGQGEHLYSTPSGGKLFAYSSRGGYDGFQGAVERLPSARTVA